MPLRQPAWILLLVLLLATTAATAAGESPVQIEAMGTLPPDEEAALRHTSRDGRHFVYGERKDGKARWVIDGEPQPFFLELITRPVWSDADGRVAYSVLTAPDEAFVLVGEQRIGPYKGANQVQFSPDGQRLAYQVWISLGGGSWYHDLCVDGVIKGERSQGILYITFSPDSQHLAYHRLRGPEQLVVLDGKPGPAFREIGDMAPVFSPDSQRLAYYSLLHTGGNAFVVDGEVQFAAAGDRGWWDLQFSPDSQRVAAVVNQEPRPVKQHWIEGYEGNESAPTWDDGTRLCWSPDSQRFGYAFQNVDGRWDMMVDGELLPLSWLEVDKRTAVVWSPDSQRWAIVGRDETGWFVYQSDGEYIRVGKTRRGTLQFSPDSEHLLYIAKRGQKPNTWQVVQSGEVLLELQDFHDVRYTPDGRLVTIGKRDDVWQLYIGDETQGDIGWPISESTLTRDGRGRLTQWTLGPDRELRRVTVPSTNPDTPEPAATQPGGRVGGELLPNLR